MRRPRLKTEKIISYLRESFWAILIALAMFLQASLLVYGFTNGYGLPTYLRVSITITPMITLVALVLFYLQHLKDKEFFDMVEKQMAQSRAQLLDSIRRHPGAQRRP